MKQRLSIVIPLGPEEPWPNHLLTSVESICSRMDVEVNVVGVNGSARDGMDKRDFINFYNSPSGRAVQINHGCSMAKREWIWVLHADSRFDFTPSSFSDAFEHLQQDGLYYLRLAFGDDGPWLCRFNAWGANLRSRWWKAPFGDQGYLFHRRLWHRVGDFDAQLASGEDHQWLWRAKAMGFEIRQLPLTMVTSARKYQNQGWLRTTCRHLYLSYAQMLRYRLLQKQWSQKEEAKA